MFKKTKVRQILELLHKDLSAREFSKILNVSRNSVAFVKDSYDKCDKDWDEICLMDDDEIYQLFYPHTFRPRNRFAPVDYSYVHSELKKVGVTEMLLWEEYCEKCNTQGVPHEILTWYAHELKSYDDKADAEQELQPSEPSVLVSRLHNASADPFISFSMNASSAAFTAALSASLAITSLLSSQVTEI